MSISLFNQREKFNTEQHKNPATPAERAEAVWDRRIGSAVVQAYNWRRISLGLIVVCIVLAAGLVWPGTAPYTACDSECRTRR